MYKKLLIISLAIIAITILTAVFKPEVACAARLPQCFTKCGSCTTNVAGTWTSYLQGESNSSIDGPDTYVLSQTGYKISNTNESNYNFYGTAFGNSINFSLVVSGEELEGYVNFCEGHIIGTNKIVAVCVDRDNQRSTFTALKS